MRRFRFAGAAILTIVGVGPAHPATPATSPAATCRAHVPEAAARSGLASHLIMRVMRAESGGSPSAVSTKGAIGCMQIMPATWDYLSRRYGLGNDAFDARMNMIGGALYLAELTRRFGLPGAYAAYNAGPARYSRYVANGVPLPSETVAYAARLGDAAAPTVATAPRMRWQEARLFLARFGGAGDTRDRQAPQRPLLLGAARPSPVSTDTVAGVPFTQTLFPLSLNATRVQR